MCNTRNDSCSVPASCSSPEREDGWINLNMTIKEKKLKYIEGENETLICQTGALLNEEVKGLMLILVSYKLLLI